MVTMARRQHERQRAEGGYIHDWRYNNDSDETRRKLVRTPTIDRKFARTNERLLTLALLGLNIVVWANVIFLWK